MAKIQDQALTVDLPTLLMDSRGQKLGMTEPGVEAMGYLSIRGQARVALRVEASSENPASLHLSLHFLSAHYDPPAGCPPEATDLIHRVNADLNARLLSAIP